MKHSGRAIVGTSPCPSPEKANVPVTTRPDTWYLHALPDFRDPIVLKDVKRPKSLTLLHTGDAVQFDFSDGTLRFSVPETSRTALVDVVELRW
jgi:alpha-L-fucosidase